jgi:hypothetical protein
MKYLRIYLNDHLAGSIAGSQLAKRCLKSNRGTPLGEFLTRLLEEIEEDRTQLRKAMEAVEASEDAVKKAAAYAAEKAGRLKLNGRLTGYSPLSRVIELEGLIIGVTGKLGLWRALRAYSWEDPRLKVIDYDQLIERAEVQIGSLEEHRVEAAVTAFTSKD